MDITGKMELMCALIPEAHRGEDKPKDKALTLKLNNMMLPNTPLPKKDSRPFYKKKRVLIPAAIIFAGIIGADMDEDKKVSTSSLANTATEQTSSAHATSNYAGGMDLKTKIIKNIKSLDAGDELMSDLSSATNIQIAAAVFIAYASIIREGRQSSDEEILKLTGDLEERVRAYQVKNFPKIRRAYYEFAKKTLWENDVDVDLSGSGNTVLKFTGGSFAANKNIKITQEALREMLTMLRFKQTQYRWYEGEDEYTYYKMETLKDAEITD